MGLRDLFVLAVILGTLPLSFRRPFVGLLVFSWLAYMRVQDLAWSVSRFRLSFLVAAALFAGFFLFEWGRKRLFAAHLRCRLLLVLLLLVGLSALVPGGGRAEILEQYVQLAKIFAIALVTTSLADTKERLRWLLLTISLSLGFFGIKGGLFQLFGGGQILRGPGGFIQDNNDFSLALVMALPFLVYLSIAERDRRVRWLLRGAAAGTVGTIALTHSRGGFLALAACAAVMVWNSRRRTLGILLGGIALLAFVVATPASYWERISSIRQYETDTSAMGRLRAWNVALQMIRGNPVLGVGFWNFQRVYYLYDPEMPRVAVGEDSALVAHNSYLQIWAECGSLAFGVYLLLLLATLRDLRRLRRAADARYFADWIGATARAFTASLAGFMVGAVFLNRGHFDLAYHVVGAAVAFSAIARRELASADLHPARVPSLSRPATAGALRWRGRAGFAPP